MISVLKENIPTDSQGFYLKFNVKTYDGAERPYKNTQSLVNHLSHPSRISLLTLICQMPSSIYIFLLGFTSVDLQSLIFSFLLVNLDLKLSGYRYCQV